MKKRHHLHHLWLIFGIYGVWFAMFSGLEEIVHGKLWKALLSLLLGIVVYGVLEARILKNT